MIRRCEGPHGEPGYLWEDPDGTRTECFWLPHDGTTLEKGKVLHALTAIIKEKVGDAWGKPAS